MLETVAAIATLIALAMSVGQTGWQSALAGLNGSTRTKVMSIVKQIENLVSSKRLDVNKLLSLLNSKQAGALSSYLSSNPAISKTMDELQQSSDLLADLTAQQSTLDSEISNLESRLSTLGYAQSHSNAGAEKEQVDALTNELASKTRKYNELDAEIKNVRISPTRDFNPDFTQLDAITQNLKGGSQ